MSAQLVLENVAVHYPNRVLFEDINWTLYSGQRVALAGRNGCGKSTLLKILSGRMEPPEGQRNVVGGKKLRIGFLDQGLLDSAVLHIHQAKENSLSPLQLLKKRLEKSTPEEDPFLDRDWEIKKILSGLGFNQEWMENSMSRLSGGWLLRVFIAETLLQNPEVLLLDEPTNHLDISSIQWLEEFIQKEYEGSLVLVTHDIALQKRVTDSLAILHGGKFYFRSQFQDYLSFKGSLKEETVLLEKSIESLQEKISDNMAFVEKFRAKAQTAARAQSKLKAAEEMQDELREMKDKLQRLKGFSYDLSFKFRLAGNGGKFPLALSNLSFSYSDDSPQILKNISIDIKRGQRIAIMGDNGTGKTTLLNVLAERLPPSNGELIKGYAVEMGYFGQHQLDELSLEDTVLDNLRSRAVGVSYEELRGWLGAFGFSTQDEIEKKAKVLSGGERARLALLRILLTRINLVLLDEPTNHLDVETKDLLKTAIREFEGTTILVSHDREFVSDIAERILYLSHDHQLTDHLGDLNSFFEKYPQFVRHLDGYSQPSQAPKEERLSSEPKPQSNLSFEERKKVKNQIKSLERKVSQLEVDLESWGAEKESLEKTIAQADFQKKPELERNQIYARLSQLQDLIHSGMVDWEKWASDLEKLRPLL